MDKEPVLVTGGTGYVGSWIVKKLLDKGYPVRLAVRNKAKSARFQHLLHAASNDSSLLTIVEADLLKPSSYHQAAEGAQAIIHAASPFKLKIKNAEKELLQPALLGTRNVLEAANASDSVKKVVLTSSVAAVHGDNIDMEQLGLQSFTEAHFNESSSLQHQPYSFSKVQAEKEAWKLYNNQSDWQLIVLNPSFVMGPPLGQQPDSESIKFMQSMLSGVFRFGAPDLYFGYVDVRDVAEAHIAALESPNAEGRHILAERTASVLEISRMLKDKYGKKFPLPNGRSPKFMLYLLGWLFGLSPAFIKKNVGISIKLDNSKSIQKLGIGYRPLNQTLEDMVEALIKPI